MSIDYKQLQALVKEAMFTSGGINEPSAPEGIPHRMPAGDSGDRQQDMGDPKANKLYALALTAREAAEQLVEGLDEPIFDSAYEQAFKASACLGRALVNIQESGAHPMPIQQVVPPPPDQQKYSSGGGDFAGGSAGVGFGGGLEEMVTGQESSQAKSLFTDFNKMTVEQQAELISMLPTPDEKGTP